MALYLYTSDMTGLNVVVSDLELSLIVMSCAGVP